MGYWCRRAIKSTALVLAVIVIPEIADAHVKWFCAYSIERQPDGLGQVVNRDFMELVALAIGTLLFGTVIDATFVGRSLNRSFYRLRRTLPIEGELLVRASCGFFLVCLWFKGGTILTPELTTPSEVVPWLQLALAACLLHRRTAIVTAIGLAALFAYAVVLYGVFHMADYPIFLGLAAYLAAVSLNRPIFGARPIDVLRWLTAITLMWASVEKWAYPEWSYPLFVNHGALGLGFSPPYYMLAAGVVEFALAFALIGTPLVRLYGAVILSAIFIAAVSSFGKIDAVGHAPIIGVLFAIVLDDYSHEIGHIRPIAMLPLKFGAALAIFIFAYYGSHAALYGTSIL